MPEPGKVSIVIPTHNRAQWLPQAIDSALSQTYSAIEVVVVDDGSDNGQVQAVVHNYPSVRLLREPHRGAGAARNTGWRVASGEYVLFLDDDDWLLPGAIAEKIAVFQAPATGAVYSDLALVDQKGTVLATVYEHIRGPMPTGDIYEALLPNNFIPLHSILWRRSVLEITGGFPDWSGMEDWHLLLCAAQVTKFGYVGRVHGAYRLHLQNMTHSPRHVRGRARVQEIVTASEAFARLAPLKRAGLLARYAAQQLVDGDRALGTRFLQQAVRTAPFHPWVAALSALAICGYPSLRRAIQLTRRVRLRLGRMPKSALWFMESV